MNKNEIELPIKHLKGVGPKITSIFSRIGVNSTRDLLYYFQREYEDRNNLQPSSQVKLGEDVLLKGQIYSL